MMVLDDGLQQKTEMHQWTLRLFSGYYSAIDPDLSGKWYNQGAILLAHRYA